MPEIQNRPENDAGIQEYFAYLDRSDRIVGWIYGGLAVGCVLAIIAAMIAATVELLK